MLQKLYDSHRQLEASAARLSRLLDAAVPDAEALQKARRDIDTRMMQHIALEDRHLFANLAKSTRPAVAAFARQYRAEYARQVVAYAEHAKWWTAERILEDWSGYGAKTHQQLRLLAKRIQQVESELFPFALITPLDAAQTPGTSWTKGAFAINDSISGAG